MAEQASPPNPLQTLCNYLASIPAAAQETHQQQQQRQPQTGAQETNQQQQQIQPQTAAQETHQQQQQSQPQITSSQVHGHFWPQQTCHQQQLQHEQLQLETAAQEPHQQQQQSQPQITFSQVHGHVWPQQTRHQQQLQHEQLQLETAAQEIHQQQQQTQPQITSSQVLGHVFPQQTRHEQQLQHEQLQLESALPHSIHKNRLQEFAQKASIRFPVYHTRSEGEHHALKFKCTVEVDGDTYTNLDTFPNRKAAEQDAARLALEGISKKIKVCVSDKTKDGGLPPIHEDRFFCKSILHEYAAKSNMEKPTYDTARLEGMLPLFVSSLVFGGKNYTGQPGVSKKEAEQLAARAAILSILADSGAESPLCEIVKSKAKYFSAVNEGCSVVTGVAQLPNSGSGSGLSTSKKRVYEDNELVENKRRSVNETANVVSGITPESGVVMAQSANNVIMPESGVAVAESPSIVITPEASKLIKSDSACEAGTVTGNAVSEGVLVQCLSSHSHELTEPNGAAFSGPSLQPLQAQTPSVGMDCGEKKKAKKKKKKANKNEKVIQMQVSSGSPTLAQ